MSCSKIQFMTMLHGMLAAISVIGTALSLDLYLYKQNPKFLANMIFNILIFILLIFNAEFDMKAIVVVTILFLLAIGSLITSVLGYLDVKNDKTKETNAVVNVICSSSLIFIFLIFLISRMFGGKGSGSESSLASLDELASNPSS